MSEDFINSIRILQRRRPRKPRKPKIVQLSLTAAQWEDCKWVGRYDETIREALATRHHYTGKYTSYSQFTKYDDGSVMLTVRLDIE